LWAIWIDFMFEIGLTAKLVISRQIETMIDFD